MDGCLARPLGTVNQLLDNSCENQARGLGLDGSQILSQHLTQPNRLPAY